jgi:pyruvate kinase
VREVSQAAGREVAIMADLQGPKIRVGKFADGKVLLEPGASSCSMPRAPSPATWAGVGLDYKELPRDVKPGDTLLLNDGLIVLTVDAVKGEQIRTTVKLGGVPVQQQGHQQAGRRPDGAGADGQGHGGHPHRDGLPGRLRGRELPKSATDMEMARQLCNVAARSSATSRR